MTTKPVHIRRVTRSWRPAVRGKEFQRRPRGTPGFTVTEMLVVLSIVIILVALLLPWLKSARSRARTAIGLAHLKEIGHAINSYVAAHAGTLPIGYDKDRPTIADPTVGANETDWAVILNYDLTGSGGRTFEIQVASGIPLLDIFRCPNATYPDQGLHHYASHPVLMPDDLFYPAHKMTQIRRPSEVVLIMDAIQRPDDPNSQYDVPYTSYAVARSVDNGILSPPGYGPEPDFPALTPIYVQGNANMNLTIDPGPNVDADFDSVNAGTAANIRWRQLNGTAANFLFPDGHAATLKMDEVKRRHILPDEAESIYQ
jgi:prepilin-type processing-associated H-X9-DG protein